jgi:hypothetical protein
VGPRAGVDGCGKSRLPPRFDPRTVQPATSRIYINFSLQMVKCRRIRPTRRIARAKIPQYLTAQRSVIARFQVLTAVQLIFQVFRDVILCPWINTYRYFEGSYKPSSLGSNSPRRLILRTKALDSATAYQWTRRYYPGRPESRAKFTKINK